MNGSQSGTDYCSSSNPVGTPQRLTQAVLVETVATDEKSFDEENPSPCPVPTPQRLTQPVLVETVATDMKPFDEDFSSPCARSSPARGKVHPLILSKPLLWMNQQHPVRISIATRTKTMTVTSLPLVVAMRRFSRRRRVQWLWYSLGRQDRSLVANIKLSLKCPIREVSLSSK